MTATAFGGSCYLNNAAIAAARLHEAAERPRRRDRHRRPPRQRHPVDLLGGRRRCLTGSVHVDPGAGWFPHYLGLRGRASAPAPAKGANLNLPLAPGLGRRGPGSRRWRSWREWADRRGRQGARGRARRGRRGRRPREPARGDRRRLPSGGRRSWATLGLPTVIVQEGGYDLDTIGELVLAAVSPFAAAA